LAGENSFLLQQELARRIAEFVREHSDLALERFDGNETEFVRIRESLESLPFLSAKKMVVLREPSANNEYLAQYEAVLTNLPETTETIIVEPKLDKRTGYAKFLQKQTEFHDCRPLDENGLVRWLAAFATEHGAKLDVPTARVLVQRIGNDQQHLAHEVQKLALYDSQISRDSIELLTDASPSSKVFDLLDAAFSGNTARALELYREQRAQKMEPQELIGLLAWQLHIVALCKTAGQRSPDQIAKEAAIHPYTAKKSAAIAKKLPLNNLKTLLTGLRMLDQRLKRESLDADEALQSYILQLASK
jgi:DNA polymerase-3 subunit delta